MTGWITGKTIAFLAMLATVAATVLSLSCRVYGVACEASPTPPDYAKTQERDRREVDKKLSTTTGLDDFEELRAQSVSGWFSKTQLLIYAKFKGSEPLLVDTLNIKSENPKVIYSENRRIAAVTILSDESTRPETNLFAYFPEIKFFQRQFTLSCSADYLTTIDIRNLSYNADSKRFLFDFVSGCTPVFVNSQYKLEAPSGQGGRKTGATAELKLTDTFHITSATTSWDKERLERLRQRWSELERDFNACRDHIATTREGEMFVCQRAMSRPDSEERELVALQWTSGGLIPVARLEKGDTSVKDPSGQAVFMTATSRNKGGIFGKDSTETLLRVVMANRPQPSSYQIVGFCQSMTIRPIQLEEDGRTLRLELQSDCGELIIDGRHFTTNFKATKDQEFMRGRFDLVADGNGFVTDLRAVGPPPGKP